MKPSKKTRTSILLPQLLFIFGVAEPSSIALAQAPVTFTAAGNMITPRFFHTATRLLDGRVLIAGGMSSYTSGVAEASAELYDPFNGTFAPTGSMTTPRNGHTATLLPNGKV